jgi:hypothetical protein
MVMYCTFFFKCSSNFKFYFCSKIGNFNVGGFINQLIKKGLCSDHRFTSTAECCKFFTTLQLINYAVSFSWWDGHHLCLSTMCENQRIRGWFTGWNRCTPSIFEIYLEFCKFEAPRPVVPPNVVDPTPESVSTFLHGLIVCPLTNFTHNRVSAAKIFPHPAFSWADISLNPRYSLSDHQYLVLFLACIVGLPREIVM